MSLICPALGWFPHVWKLYGALCYSDKKDFRLKASYATLNIWDCLIFLAYKASHERKNQRAAMKPDVLNLYYVA